MRTRKYGILGLMLGASLLAAACDSETTAPPPAVTVTVSPDPVPPLNIGQTVQMVAVVANSTNQQVTWTSSTPAVASVSATGLVTALTQGVTVITATSAADPNARDAVTVQVNPPAAPPTISIKSVTQGGLNQPVNPNNVSGQIDVTLNVDVPAGAQVTRVETLIDGNVVCSQGFQGGADIAMGDEANAPQVEIVCSINTAAFNATTGVPTFLNGPHTLTARLVQPGGNIIATPSTALIFNNIDMINATVTTSKAPAIGPGGLSWRGGDVVVTGLPVIYSGAAGAVGRISATLSASGAAAIMSSTTADLNASCASTGRATPLAGCVATPITLQDTDPAGGFVVTFSNANRWNAATPGVLGIEDPALGVAVTAVTSGGQNFSGNINVLFGTAPVSGTNPLRLDNLAPRVLQFALLSNFYVNDVFAFGGTTAVNQPGSVCDQAVIGNTTGAPCYVTLDYGVDSQTSVFNIVDTSGTAVTGGTGVQNAAGAAETSTATQRKVAAVVTDALGNSRTVYGTAPGTAPSATLAGGVTIGFDFTEPTIAVSGPADNSTAAAPGAANLYTFTASDAGVGPSGVSGFGAKVEQITPTGTVCLHPVTLASISCTTNSGVVFVASNPFSITVPDVPNAYYRVTVTASDIALNVSPASARLQLRDFTPPVVGGIATPSSITGGAAAQFSAPATDNIELGDILPVVGFEEGATDTYLAYARQTIGTYGPATFSNTSTGNFTIDPFIRSIEISAVPAAGQISRASELQMATRDVAGVELNDPCPGTGAADDATTQNCRFRTANILSAVAFGIGGTGVDASWTSAGRPFGPFNQTTNPTGGGTAFAQQAPNPATVCSDNPVGAAAGCATVTARSTTLSATAMGPAQTFANPFSRLVFYYRVSALARSFEACTAAASASDNTTNNTRTWTYTCTFTPTIAAGAYQVFALGVDTSGRALMSAVQGLTITSD